jgi:hypothetical protein
VNETTDVEAVQTHVGGEYTCADSCAMPCGRVLPMLVEKQWNARA